MRYAIVKPCNLKATPHPALPFEDRRDEEIGYWESLERNEMHSDVPSIRSQRNAKLEAEIKEYDEAQKNPKSEEHEDDSSELQKGGDPTSSATTGWEKRYADLRSYSQKQLNEAKAETARLQQQLQDVTKEEIQFPKTEEELDEWVNKYPDVAAMIETIALKKMQGLKDEITNTKLTWEQEKLKKASEMAFNKLLEAHPDFLELRETSEFQTWAEDQAKWVQVALYENDTDAKSVIDAVDLYKFKNQKAASKATPKVDERKEAARSTGRSTSAKPDVAKQEGFFLESAIKKMGHKEYDLNAAAIEKAYQEGKIIYDISGAAR